MKRIGLLAAGPLLALAVAGCGTAEGGAGVATAGTPSGAATSAPGGAAPAADERSRMRQFTQCLREHGVQVEDSGGNGPTKITGRRGDRGTMDAAMKACRKYAPGSGGPAGGKPDPEALAAMRAFAKCMRAEGITEFPDPDASGGGIRIERRNGSGLRPDSPEFQAAQKACEKHLPDLGQKW